MTKQIIMQYRYIYKSKKTGHKIYTNEKQNNPDWELVFELRGGLINQDKIIKK